MTLKGKTSPYLVQNWPKRAKPPKYVEEICPEKRKIFEEKKKKQKEAKQPHFCWRNDHDGERKVHIWRKACPKC